MLDWVRFRLLRWTSFGSQGHMEIRCGRFSIFFYEKEPEKLKKISARGRRPRSMGGMPTNAMYSKVIDEQTQ